MDFKSIIKTKLESAFNNERFQVTNELQYEPFKNYNDNDVVVVIQNGVGRNATINGIDFVTKQINIMFMFDANKTEYMMNQLSYFIEQNNAKYEASGSYTYRMLFGTPFRIGNPRDYRKKNATESFKYQIISLTIDVEYTKSVTFNVPTLKVTVGTTEYSVLGLLRYESSDVPTYEPIMFNDEIRAERKYIGESTTFVITMSVIKNNAFHNLLIAEYFKTSGKMSGSVLKFKEDSNQITIKEHSISRVWENGQFVITLTLIV